MKRDHDHRTGRPLIDGRDLVDALTDEELEAELTIASEEPIRRARRLDVLLLERAKRRGLRAPQPA